MTLKEYIKKLQKIAKDHPNLNVIYASDDEGNNFKYVGYEPSIGDFEDGEFTFSTEKINAICIN